jgi:hypothetical protein
MADTMASNVSKAVSNALDQEQAPRLLLNLIMEAPRVALPLKPAVGAETAETMVLDFGRFRLQSDKLAQEELSEDEALVYECMVLKGSNVQANLVMGEFSWQKWEVRTGQRSCPTLILRLAFCFLRFHLSPLWTYPNQAMCDSADSGSIYPLIEPIEMYCKMQYGKFNHPTLPRLRSKVRIL